MNEFLSVAALVVAVSTYASVWVWTMRLAVDHLGWGRPAHNPGTFFLGMFWPAGITFLLIHHLPTLAAKAGKGLLKVRLPSRKIKSNEIIPGVSKPTDVLYGMVAVRLLQEVENITGRGDRREWKSKDGKMSISALSAYDEWHEGSSWRLSLSVGKQTFGNIREGSLIKTWKKAINLKTDFDKNAEIMAKENEALTAIESIMLTPETT